MECCNRGGYPLELPDWRRPADPHPNGIVIHPQAEIGVNCLILQQVTIAVGDSGAPQLRGHVDIGAGKILGAIRIGAHARVGANAVVLSDVPENCTAVGVPARKCLI